ncbi:MAG: site-2 protease family protein [Actinomycetota bacterium]
MPAAARHPAVSRGLRIARPFGIDLRVDPSWSVSLLILSAFAYEMIVPSVAPHAVTGARAALAVVFALPIAACIVVHELAHSLVARAWGVPVRGITLFAFGGVSQMDGEAPSAVSEYQIAVAGPLASVMIAGLMAGVARGIAADGHLSGPWGAIAVVNLYLALFNLLPAFPMDGGRILRSLLWAGSCSRARATKVAALAGRGFAVLFIAVGAITFTLSTLSGDGGMGSGIWIALVGLFLYKAAQTSGRFEGGEHPNEEPR